MGFDSTTRGKLQRLVTACRNLLTDEFDDQLQSIYGIYADDGRVLEIEKLASLDDDQRVTGALLRERIAHLQSGLTSSKTPLKDAVQRVLRDQAFTVLNRFAALRMAEERELVLQCVGDGLNSKGFQVFENVASPDLGSQHERYCVFLGCLFDELSLDLGVLFDRFSPFGLLFPREPKLNEFLSLLNDPELKSLWREDETIGWIYQYFNDEAERKKMREESSAPRNSRELAVRNQFFTPRYVVEFLTDNTLGRLWYEMTRGETVLRDRCRYLVRRPTEVFLKPGESAPESSAGSEAGARENLSQEELLRQPVHIPYRSLKDPREIRLLDPACGSMHFGLYAFDLFTVIYDEAWKIAHGPDDTAKSVETFAPFVAFAATFPDKAAFLREVPRLIVERNIHGIDIDPRAAQIAGLSLWLRAQRAWHQAGVKPADRPRITRSNLVCAEPMPGEKELLREFVEQQFPAGERPAFAFLLEKIFDCMTLAGEAGSLLRIEEEIRTAIADAKRLWKQGPRHEQASLFAEPGEKAGQGEMRLDLSGITDEQFWERAEQRIYDALEAYAGQAENGGGFQRRLFADDAAQGFAFIDLCRKRYDVVVMNPPFGEASLGSRTYLYEALPEASRDVFAGFVTRFNKLLSPEGRLGVLSNRTAFYSDFLARWRVENFLGEVASLAIFADLGYGVLDAVVEAAAYVCSKHHNAGAHFINVLGSGDKAGSLLQKLSGLSVGQSSSDSVIRDLRVFERLPDHRFVYQLHPFWVSKLHLDGEHRIFTSRSGLTTGDDPRLLRLSFELPANQIGERWRWIAKGGEFARYRSDLHLLADWQNRDSFVRMRNPELYGKRGVTYTERTTSNMSARVLNESACFSVPGPGIIPKRPEHLHFLLAYINSFAASYVIEAMIGGGDFSMKGTAARHLEPGYMKHLPEVDVSMADAEWFSERVTELLRLLGTMACDESDPLFTAVPLKTGGSLSSALETATRETFGQFKEAYRIVEALEKRITVLLQIPEERIRDTYSDTGWPWAVMESVPDGDHSGFLSADPLSPRVGIPEGDSPPSNRFETKLSHYIHAAVERYAASTGVSPIAICQLLAERAKPSAEALTIYAGSLTSFALGTAFGRWDIRYATGDRPAPELSDPFAPLPVCPPGMLQGDDGLPLSPEAGRRLRAEGRYPLDVAWDGILVDDPENPLDLERRVHAALAALWGERADALEHEACALLGVPTLREWFRRPAGFFADHLKRYSKSRRQAPIYWPLSTPSGSYTLWLYYHQLNDQTLYTCVTDFVKPKRDAVTADADRLQAKTQTGGTAKERAELQELRDFQAELQELHEELLRVAQFPWKPNLNDGVLITASPLWKLFRLPKWQKDLKGCWEELAAGDYDWAHLAHTIWPDRVREMCKTDRSLAIAHGLEDLCEVEAPKPKTKRGKKGGKLEKLF